MNGLEVEDNVEKLKQGIKKDGTRLTVEGMKLQLNWHRRHDKAVPSKSEVNKLKKGGILELLIAAVKRRIASGGHFAQVQDESTEDINEDWEEREERDEADLMDMSDNDR